MKLYVTVSKGRLVPITAKWSSWIWEGLKKNDASLVGVLETLAVGSRPLLAILLLNRTPITMIIHAAGVDEALAGRRSIQDVWELLDCPSKAWG